MRVFFVRVVHFEIFRSYLKRMYRCSKVDLFSVNFSIGNSRDTLHLNKILCLLFQRGRPTSMFLTNCGCLRYLWQT